MYDSVDQKAFCLFLTSFIDEYNTFVTGSTVIASLHQDESCQD